MAEELGDEVVTFEGDRTAFEEGLLNTAKKTCLRIPNETHSVIGAAVVLIGMDRETHAVSATCGTLIGQCEDADNETLDGQLHQNEHELQFVRDCIEVLRSREVELYQHLIALKVSALDKTRGH